MEQRTWGMGLCDKSVTGWLATEMGEETVKKEDHGSLLDCPREAKDEPWE